MVYEKRNLLYLRFDPLGNVTETDYDGNRNLATVIDRDHRQTTFSYDNDNNQVFPCQ